ncbi:cysteine alpha-hairpin motif superfamily [Trichoderma sp. SZMC 28011]
MATPSEGPKDGPWTDETKQKFESKSKSEFYDPCQEAAQRSYKCLYRNNGDKSMCGEYFQAYRDCKQAWKRGEKRGVRSGELFHLNVQPPLDDYDRFP